MLVTIVPSLLLGVVDHSKHLTIGYLNNKASFILRLIKQAHQSPVNKLKDLRDVKVFGELQRCLVEKLQLLESSLRDKSGVSVSVDSLLEFTKLLRKSFELAQAGEDCGLNFFNTKFDEL